VQLVFLLRLRFCRWGSAVLLCALAPACGRVGYDLLGGADVLTDLRADAGSGGTTAIGTGSGGFAGATQAGSGAATGSGGAGGSVPGVGGSIVGGGGSGGTTGAGGAPNAGGAAQGGATSRDGGTTLGDAGGGGPTIDAGPGMPPVDCKGGRGQNQLWTFATGVDSWYFAVSPAVQGSMTRVLTPFDLEPGALRVDITAVGTDSRSWVQSDAPQPNQGGHTAYAAIWLDSDTVAWTKLFAQSGATGVWMDGGTLTLTPHAWTCFHLVFDAPDFVNGTPNLTAVSRLGLELSGKGPFRVYIDDIGY
jgi:hypothetical protein